MNKYPKPLAKLINELSRLPGVGNKSAQRLAFHILDMDEEDAVRLAESITEAKRTMKRCSVCGNLTDSDPCALCSDPNRGDDIICVVESPKDVMAMERLNDENAKWKYHVLHGVISPMDGIGPSDLNLMSLIKRLQKSDVKEVIVATNPNLQGEATATYIASLIKPAGIKVTRLAHGIPVGGDLEYADEVTLLKSIEGRREL